MFWFVSRSTTSPLPESGVDDAALERCDARRARVVSVDRDEVRGRAGLEPVDAIGGLDREVGRLDRRSCAGSPAIGTFETTARRRAPTRRPPSWRSSSSRGRRRSCRREDPIAGGVRVGIAGRLDRVAVGVEQGGRLRNRARVAVVADAVEVLVAGAAGRVLAEVHGVGDAVAVEVAGCIDAGRARRVGEVADRARAAGPVGLQSPPTCWTHRSLRGRGAARTARLQCLRFHSQ